MYRRTLLPLMVILVLALVPAPQVASAQGPDNQPVTADDVNNVARKLYCPVCENIPLDTCGTPACQQWRDEIRIQLEAGRTPDQVIADFVTRFGDRVVGTPQDPLLKALSLVVPWGVSVLGVLAALVIFARWSRAIRQGEKAVPSAVGAGPAANPDEQNYRARLEADLRRRT